MKVKYGRGGRRSRRKRARAVHRANERRQVDAAWEVRVATKRSIRASQPILNVEIVQYGRVGG